ncbi:hypothetical protein HK104_009161 [Borealophlyctis nickersoniae]|nr:hypothetical protein HK104_009161 [Borealophlyctis nickersoniae]
MSTQQQQQQQQLRDLYPQIEPFDTGFLKVDDTHSIYYEQSGNRDGKPVVFLHGGPGGGTSGEDRRYFDPAVYRIVLFDQRGAGKSTPYENNDTWSLVADIEKIRTHLHIPKWVVFGGSWGSTLALAYAQTHPESVKGLILRGIFTLRDSEIQWFYQEGASHVFPDVWEDYLAPIPPTEHGDLVTAYHNRLTGPDTAEQLRCAASWSKWECATSRLFIDPAMLAKSSNPTWSLAFARIESHYFHHRGFFPTPQHILDNVPTIRHHNIPGVIIQGRYDMVCPFRTAWDLHKRWPEAEFVVVEDAGHSAREVGVRSRLVEAADKFRDL